MVVLVSGVSAGTGSVSAETVSSIILPRDSQVTVEFISSDAECIGSLWLHAPTEMMIFEDYTYQVNVAYLIPQRFPAGTELIFRLLPGNYCGDIGAFRDSTNTDHAIIEKISGEDAWEIYWEDYTDEDFNDLILRVSLTDTVIPFLDLPFDYEGSTFAEQVSDYDLGGPGDGVSPGKAMAYFDHDPTASAVSFHGYDGTGASGLTVDDSSHQGIDFSFEKFGGGTPVDVLAAADGTVAGVVMSGGGLGNHVVLTHTNGFTTTYGLMSNISVTAGMTVTQGEALGTTGADTNYALRFLVQNIMGYYVDPFGWTPFPDAAHTEDPWSQANGEDATNYYLWTSSLDAAGVSQEDAPTVVPSQSREITATIPAGGTAEPYRFEVWETLNGPDAPAALGTPVKTFAVHAYGQGSETEEETPVWMLDEPIYIEYKRTDDGGYPRFYWVYRWDTTSDQWVAVATSDNADGGASASTSKLGTFMVTWTETMSIHLPLALR
jgi:murein DD-endopeptidase MepM/ murein hydrolase activator NlpD